MFAQRPEEDEAAIARKAVEEEAAKQAAEDEADEAQKLKDQVVSDVAPGKRRSTASARTQGDTATANITAPAFSLLQCAKVRTASGVESLLRICSR